MDTSVWVDHLRRRNVRLCEALTHGRVWSHPFVAGELVCGNLSARNEVLRLLAALPQAPIVEHTDVLQLVDEHRLQGRGIGWIDMHLLASAHRAELAFWTLDKRLAGIARELALAPPG